MLAAVTVATAFVAVQEGSVVTVIVALISALAVTSAPIFLLLAKQHMEMTKMRESMIDTAKEIVKVGVAVNNVPEGEPTLIEQVRRLSASSRWRDQFMIGMARHVGFKHDPPPTFEENAA